MKSALLDLFLSFLVAAVYVGSAVIAYTSIRSLFRGVFGL